MKLTKSQLRKIIKEELGKISEQELDISPSTFIERVAPLMRYLEELSGRDINFSWPASERNWAEGITDFTRLVKELMGSSPTPEVQPTKPAPLYYALIVDGPDYVILSATTKDAVKKEAEEISGYVQAIFTADVKEGEL